MVKKVVFFCWFFVLMPYVVWGQTHDELRQYGDSLYRQLQKITDQEQKADALFDLSFFWSDYDTTKAFGYIKEGERLLGNNAKSAYYQGVLHFYQASVYFETDPAKAKQSYMEAERFLKQEEHVRQQEAWRYRARLWGSYGALMQREGNADAYVEILLDKVIPMAKRIGDSTLMGNNYQNVAMALMNLQEYEKASQNYEKALSLLQDRAGAEEQRFTLYVNAARNALFDKDHRRSRKFLDAADSLTSLVPYSSYMPMYHTVAGSYWATIKSFDKARSHFDKGVAAAKAQHNEDMLATLLFDQFLAFKANGEYASAQEKLLEVLPYVQQKPSAKNKQMVYYNLATTASELGQHQEAVKWYEAYKHLTDTIAADEGKERILELETKYQAKEKENELLQIKTASQQQQLSLQKTRVLVGVLVLIIIVLAISSFAWYTTQKGRRKLATQKERLLQEELKNHRQQEKLNLYNAMLQGEERERSRIARDLHDGLGGMLASVKLKLSAVAGTVGKRKSNEESTMDLYTIIHQLDHAAGELRRLARNMMPESLLYMGLEAALGDLCNAMAHSGMQVNFQATGLRKDYQQSFLIAVYRIVQELLANVIRHSEATEVWVHCTQEKDQFYIMVEDNGRGFDPKNDLLNKKGMGISNIRNRTELLNGQLEIDSSPGKGASFHIQLTANG